MLIPLLIPLPILMLSPLLGCGGSSAPPAPPDVVALSTPVRWLAGRIATSEVRLFPPPDADPPHWQPSGDAIATLASADLIIANGAGYEAWMATAALPPSRLIDSAAGVALIATADPTHSHGAGAHSHGAVDPHTWLDPSSFIAQARNIEAGLSRAWPEDAEGFSARRQAVESQLRDLSTALGEAAPPPGAVPLFAAHASYAYLARATGMDIRDLDLDPKTPPEAARRMALARELTAGSVLLWERTPTPAVTAALPPGIRHLVLDPLEFPPADGDYDYLTQGWANVEILRSLAPPP